MTPDAPEGAPPNGSTAPRFVDAGSRSSRCEVVAVVRAPDGVELRFGTLEGRAHCPGAVGAALTHRVRLDLSAARHLEEALTRVLGAGPSPTEPEEAGR